MIQNQGL